jgi:transaldolase
MQATQFLHNLGQSIWLDNITPDLLDTGTLPRYVNELSVAGLTSNPTIFEHAIRNSLPYDVPIRNKVPSSKSSEELFDLGLEDITRAANLFHPIHDQTNAVDGWVRWKSHRCWPTIRKAHCARRNNCLSGPIDQTCSLRCPAPTKGFQP